MTSTLPPGFVFDSMINGPYPDPPSDPSQPVWELGDMAASGSNTVLEFRVINDGSSCGTVTPGSNVFRIDYQDSCDNSLSVTNTGSTINPSKPELSISKTPSIQPVAPGGTGSWTITVTNTGDTAAYNVTVIDTLGADWGTPINAGTGTNGEVPIVSGNTITWQIPGPIAQSGGTWSATLSATLNVDAGTATNEVEVSGKCSNGCVYSSDSDSARIINVDGIFKESQKEKATIGEEVNFVLLVNYTGVNSIYSDVTIIDTLPVGIEYISHTYIDNYGTTPQFSQNGEVLTWTLEDFNGPNSVLINITGKIRDITSNVRDVILVNSANTNFIQDGEPFSISDSDSVRIVEPQMHIIKEADKSQGLPGENVHYTITITNTGNSSAYDVVIRDEIPSGLLLDQDSIVSSPQANETIVSGNIIQWTYLSISPDASYTLEYDATIPPQGGFFPNTATNTFYYSLSSINPVRRVYTPLSDDWEITAPGTQLDKITLNTEVNVPSPGGTVYFRLIITNSGAMPLNPVRLIDRLPDGLTYIPGSSYVGGTPYEPDTIFGSPEILTWDNIGAMDPNDAIVVEFEASVDPGRTGTFVNEATVIGTSSIGDVTDTDTSQVGVKGPAINITKSVSPPWGKLGFNNEYTLMIANTGEVILDPVSVIDILPLGLTYENVANPKPDIVTLNSDGTTTLEWINIGPLGIGENKTITYYAKFNGRENRSINYVSAEGVPPNGFPVSDQDQVGILKQSGADPRTTLRIITKTNMNRCDLCYTQGLIDQARRLLTNRNIEVVEPNDCCMPENVIEELKIEIVRRGLDRDPRYLTALSLLDDAFRLCREAETAYNRTNYSLAHRLTKEKCEAINKAMRLMIDILS